MARNEKRVKEILYRCTRVFEVKGRKYKHSYKDFGKILMVLFPKGITIKTVEEANRFGIYFMMIHKMMRIAGTNFGSIDSLDDLIVYSAMLEDITEKKYF